jgi:hypothetical protein
MATRPSKQRSGITAPRRGVAPQLSSKVDEGGPKLRGKRQMVTFSLPPGLVAKVDAKAAKERRSRANMIEVLLEESLEREARQEEAAC